MNTAGDVAQKLHYDATQEANQAALTGFHNAQVQWELDNLHNPKTGLLNQQTGLAAPQAVDKTLQNYDQFTSTAIAQMPNPEQRQMASQYVAAHRAQLSDQAFRYEDQQVKTAHMNIMENGVALQGQAMTAHADDPQAVQQNLDAMKAMRQDQGKALGWDPDTVQRFVTEDQSKASLGMLRQMVADNKGPQAQAWFEQNRSRLVGPQLTEATDLLKVKGDQDQGLAIANSLINLPRPAGEAADLQSSLTRLDGMNITNASLYRQARDELVSHYHLAQEAQNQHNGQIMDKAYDEMQSSPIHAISADTWATVPPELKPRMVAAQKRLIDQGYIETEPAAYNDFHQRLLDARADPQALNKIQPAADYFGQVSPQHIKAMNDLKQASATAAAKQDDTWAKGLVPTQLTNELFKAQHLSDITAKPGTPEAKAEEDANAAMQGQFLMQLHRAIGARQLAEHKDLNDDEQREEAQKLFATQTWTTMEKNPDYRAPEDRSTVGMVLSGVFGAGDTQDIPAFSVAHAARTFEAPWASRRAYSVRDIPEKDANPNLTRAGQLALAVKHGVTNPTEEQLVDGYNTALAQSFGAKP